MKLRLLRHHVSSIGLVCGSLVVGCSSGQEHLGLFESRDAPDGGSGTSTESGGGANAADASPGLQTDGVEIVRGIPDRGRDPAVLALSVNGEQLCTGTLIAPDAVLTARHCLSETAVRVECPSVGSQVMRDREPSAIRVFAGETIADMDLLATGRQIVVPPTDQLCDADIAVLLLDRPIEGIPALSIRHHGAAKGDHVRAVGFGRIGDDSVAGRKVLRDHVRVLDTSPKEFIVGEATCSGDSGGPALDEQSGEIVGVISRGGPTCDGPNAHNIYTRTDAYDGLITEALKHSHPSASAGGAKQEAIARKPESHGKKASGDPAADKPAVHKPAARKPAAHKPSKKKPETDIGGACETGVECASGVCVTAHGGRYCSRDCGSGDHCPAHFKCEGAVGKRHVCVET